MILFEQRIRDTLGFCELDEDAARTDEDEASDSDSAGAGAEEDSDSRGAEEGVSPNYKMVILESHLYLSFACAYRW